MYQTDFDNWGGKQGTDEILRKRKQEAEVPEARCPLLTNLLLFVVVVSTTSLMNKKKPPQNAGNVFRVRHSCPFVFNDTKTFDVHARVFTSQHPDVHRNLLT